MVPSNAFITDKNGQTVPDSRCLNKQGIQEFRNEVYTIYGIKFAFTFIGQMSLYRNFVIRFLIDKIST